jgi:hypothetical protein
MVVWGFSQVRSHLLLFLQELIFFELRGSLPHSNPTAKTDQVVAPTTFSILT